MTTSSCKICQEIKYNRVYAISCPAQTGYENDLWGLCSSSSLAPVNGIRSGVDHGYAGNFRAHSPSKRPVLTTQKSRFEITDYIQSMHDINDNTLRRALLDSGFPVWNGGMSPHRLP